MQRLILLALSLTTYSVFGQNNFNLSIQEVNLPNAPGLQSFVVGQHDGKWLLLGGRTEGLHQRQPWASFQANDNNTMVYVVDPVGLEVWSSSISDLPTPIFEQLQSTNMEFSQRDTVLYITGGYGYSATANDHITHPYLTAVNIPSAMDAVMNGSGIAPHVRYLNDDRVAITGGYMDILNNVFYSVGGQLFEGRYNPMGPNNGPGFTQVYTESIKKFEVIDDGSSLSIANYTETVDAANLHRRDYNMVPQIFPNGDDGFTAFSGVFRPDADLPWHNSVDITEAGYTVNNDFDQLLSQYHSAHLPIYDQANNEMHTLFFGGMSRYYYDQNGTLVDDEEVPFVKTISLVSRDANGDMTEQRLELEMPAFLGSGAEFMPLETVDYIQDEILNLNSLTAGQETLVGYIFGGIESTAENIFFINDGTQSSASTRMFEVYITASSSTGIEGTPIAGDDVFRLQVFPNPTDTQATACLMSKYLTSGKLEVFNATGQLVNTIAVENIHNTHKHFDLGLEGAKSGNYIVTFSNNTFSTSKTLVIQ